MHQWRHFRRVSLNIPNTKWKLPRIRWFLRGLIVISRISRSRGIPSVQLDVPADLSIYQVESRFWTAPQGGAWILMIGSRTMTRTESATAESLLRSRPIRAFRDRHPRPQIPTARSFRPPFTGDKRVSLRYSLIFPICNINSVKSCDKDLRVKIVHSPSLQAAVCCASCPLCLALCPRTILAFFGI